MTLLMHIMMYSLLKGE